jgi:hypothetical protein
VAGTICVDPAVERLRARIRVRCLLTASAGSLAAALNGGLARSSLGRSDSSSETPEWGVGR